jgi:tRNA threonylcarbamoyladenosine biosynthesis protein TsaB
MTLLALDTTARIGSLALLRRGHVAGIWTGNPTATHGQQLPGAIQALLAREGLRVADVDLFAVAVGPGSFTGLRVGMATVQGLALVNGRRVVPVSSLEAVASGARLAGGGRRVAAWIDARRGEVFGAVYDGTVGASDGLARDAATGLSELAPPTVGVPLAVLHDWRSVLAEAPVAFAGDGARVYRAVIADRLGTRVEVLEWHDPLAPIIGTIALARAAAGGAVEPHALVPVYVRRPDAEIARDRTA